MREMDRQNVIGEIVDNYIEQVRKDITQFDDVELLYFIIRGEGFTPITELSDDQLVVEYKELFKEKIKIVDEIF